MSHYHPSILSYVIIKTTLITIILINTIYILYICKKTIILFLSVVLFVIMDYELLLSKSFITYELSV